MVVDDVVVERVPPVHAALMTATVTKAMSRFTASLYAPARVGSGQRRLRVPGWRADIPGVTVDIQPGMSALELFSPRIAGEWATLAQATSADPFSHPDWVRAWGDMAGRQPLVATVRSDAGLVAAYPMFRRGRVWRSAADWHTPHLDIVGVPGAAAALVAGVVAGSRRVSFDFATGATADVARRSLADAGFVVRERVRQRSPWIDLAPGWEAYHDALPSRKWREIRRRRRRLEEEGTVAYSQHDGRIDLARLLTDGFAVEGSGWKEAAGTAIRSDPRVEAFYRRVAAWGAERGMLRLHFLRLGSRAIAFDLAFIANGAEWLLKTGFDPALFSYSPGSLLRAEVLERCFADGLTRYEFLGTAAPWKLEWTAQTRDVTLLDGFAPGAAGRAADLGARVKRRLGIMWTQGRR